MKNSKVLITYMESGMGHIMSARSISDALKKKYAESLDIVDSDIMKEEKNERLMKYEKNMSGIVKIVNKFPGTGAFFFSILEAMGAQRSLMFFHKTFFRKSTEKTIQAMRKHNPDVIVSTHHFITHCAVELKKRYMPNVIVITYNPDNNLHMWWDNRSEVFITNNEMASKEAIKKRKFKPEAIRNVNFTAREAVINANESKEYYRKKYDLPIDNFTVIIGDGAYASAKAKKITKALLTLNRKITIITIAGKNKKLYDKLIKEIPKVQEKITFKVFEFMPQIYELYGASDVFITKGGPNAILDSLQMGTPIVVDYWAHPIEKATTKLFVDEFGCGETQTSRRKVKNAVCRLMDNPHILEIYRNNSKMKIDKSKNGAEEVADIIMTEITKRKNEQKPTSAEVDVQTG